MRDASGRLCAEGFISPDPVRSMMPRSGFSARLLLTSVMLSSIAYGEANQSPLLPDAPIAAAVKMRVFGAVDWSLAGSVLMSRTLDWTSTEECLRRPWRQCHEVELPTGLVENKLGFAAFEAAVSGLSILAQYEMTRHGHRRLVRLGQTVDVGSIGYAVVHNYKNGSNPVVMPIVGKVAR
jgi:hypothetical protein